MLQPKFQERHLLEIISNLILIIHKQENQLLHTLLPTVPDDNVYTKIERI